MIPVAHLAFGYLLGCPEGDEGWLIEEADRWGRFSRPWMSLDDDDIHHAMTLALLIATGVEEGEVRNLGWSHRARKLWMRKGIRVAAYRHNISGPQRLFLAASEVYSAPGMDSLTVSIPAVEWESCINLQWALGVLGMSPTQENPAWTLFSGCYE